MLIPPEKVRFPVVIPSMAEFPSDPPLARPSYPGPLSPEFLTMITDSELKYTSVIQKIEPAKCSEPISRPFCRESSLGSLVCLPPEILYMVLTELDILSLVRLTRTSLGARSAVDTLPAYTTLLTHAGVAVAALGRTKLLDRHPIADLLAALHSPSCASCGGPFGAFLYLLTAERTCYQCNISSPSLALAPLAVARRAFALPSSADLPALHPVPVAHLVHRITYSRCGLPYTQRSGLRTSLVSIRQARQLAVATHGSDAAVAALVPQKREGKMTFAELGLRQHLHALPAAHHPGYAFWTDAPVPLPPQPEYGGLAAVTFPYAVPGGAGGEVDPGRRCFGCFITDDDLYRGLMPDWALQRILPLGASANDLRRVSQAEKNRARGWDEHWRHVGGCWGVRRLMLEDGRRMKLFLSGGRDGLRWCEARVPYK